VGIIKEKNAEEDTSIDVSYPLTYPEIFQRHLNEPMLVPSRMDRIVTTRGCQQVWNNPCNHTVIVNKTRPPSAQTDFFGTVVTTDPGGQKPDAYAAFLHIPIPDAEALQRAGSFAYKSLTSLLTPRAELLASIFEMFTEFGGLMKKAISVIVRWRKQQEVFVATLKSLMTTGVDSTTAYWLAWNFAIAPMLGDIEAMFCSVHHADRKVQWLIAHNHRATRTHARRFGAYKHDEPVSVVIGGPGEFYEGFWSGGPLGSQPIAHDIPATYVAEMVSYSADYFASATMIYHLPLHLLTTTNVWLGEMGMYNLASALWEATPFSWVVDYFTSLIKDLTAVMNQPFDPWDGSVELNQVGSSWKIRAVFDVYCVNAGTGVREYLGPITIKRYIRVVGLSLDPLSFTDLFKVPVMGQQLGNLSSVAWQKRPQKWRRGNVKVRIRR
jgi:hypothetical protein